MQDKIPENDQQQGHDKLQPSQQKINPTNKQSSYVPYQSPQGKKPTIQAKQRPVDQSADRAAKQTPVQQKAKEGQTLKLGDKEINLAQIPFDRYYDEKGNFLFEDTKKTDYVKVISTKNLEQYIAKREPGFMMKFIEAVKNENTTLLLKVFTEVAVGIQEAHLSASAYSSIYTDILEKAGYDMEDVINEAISIKNGEETFNKPHPKVNKGFAGTNKTGIGGTELRISVNQQSTGAKLELTTVSNIINSLGAHEYMWHGKKGFGTSTGDHWVVYEKQVEDKSWEKTTPILKINTLRRYQYYLNQEKPKGYQQKIAKAKAKQKTLEKLSKK